MILRLIPNSPAVDAVHICYMRQTPYTHDGKMYIVKKISAIGKGRDTRVEAELQPVFKA
ncbi:hypothetical protein ACUVN4_001376 [Vibrio cholerae]